MAAKYIAITDDFKLVKVLRNKNFSIQYHHCFVFYKNIQWFPQLVVYNNVSQFVQGYATINDDDLCIMN